MRAHATPSGTTSPGALSGSCLSHSTSQMVMKRTIWNHAAVGSAAHDEMAPPGRSENLMPSALERYPGQRMPEYVVMTPRKPAIARRPCLISISTKRRQHANLVELRNEGVDLNVCVARHINVRLRGARGRDRTLALRRLGRGRTARKQTLRLLRAALRRSRLRRLCCLLLWWSARTASESGSRSGNASEQQQRAEVGHSCLNP